MGLADMDVEIQSVSPIVFHSFQNAGRCHFGKAKERPPLKHGKETVQQDMPQLHRQRLPAQEQGFLHFAGVQVCAKGA